MKFTDAITKGLTGRRSQKPTTGQSLKAGKQAYGDTWKNVARESGVSERTLRRIRAGGKPGKSTRNKLTDFANRREVRQASVRPGRARKLRQAGRTGAKVKLQAHQGPRGRGGGDYKRPRHVEFDLPPEAVQALEDAYLSGDSQALESLMKQYVSEFGWADWTPPGGWEVGETDEWDFDPL